MTDSIDKKHQVISYGLNTDSQRSNYQFIYEQFNIGFNLIADSITANRETISILKAFHLKDSYYIDIPQIEIMVRYFSSDEVSTPQGIVPCTICSVGNVIHFLIVELLIVSDNKVKNKTYKTIRTVPISNIKKNREKRQNPYPNTQNMTAHSPLTLQFYIIFLSLIISPYTTTFYLSSI